jgi:hypothetical protein
MHTHDRTFISSLGFADPDKHEPLHDLACAYISLPDIAKKIMGKEPTSGEAKFQNTTVVGNGGTSDEYRCIWTGTLRRGVTYAHSLEVPIVKGEGKFQTTIGFVDAVLQRNAESRFYGTCQPLERDWDVDGERAWKSKEPYSVDGDGGDELWGAVPAKLRPKSYSDEQLIVGVEVKIRSVPVGDLLRQLKLYMGHVGRGFSIERVDRWVAVLRYNIDDDYYRTLESEGVHVVRLGEAFGAWLAARKKTPARLGQI